MKIGYYILDKDRQPVEVGVMEWERWHRNMDNRRVALTEFECGVAVSTVFLGLDHRFDNRGPMLLYETMVFEMEMEGGGGDMWRYSTWDDAEIGHKAAVRKVKALIEKAGLSTKEIEDAC